MILDDNGDPRCDKEGNPTFEEESFVIKDNWLHVDSLLERDIQNAVFNALGDDAKDARQYFLTILSEGIVQIGNENDVTPICDPKDATPIYWTSPQSTLLTASSEHKFRQDGTPQSQSQSETASPPYTARMHVRTVFKEHCISVYELTDHRSLLLCLEGCVEGMCAPQLARQ